jgi:RNA polymerase sigma-70 factor (ECF subfamily)
MTEAPRLEADERVLLAALRAHDESAFEALVRRYSPALFRAALSLTRNRTLAEEVVQDTWAGVLRGLERFEGRSSLKTWIFRILMNQAKTRAARERRSVPFSSLFDPGPAAPAIDPGRFEPADHPLYPRWWTEYPTPWSELPEEKLVDKETMAVIAEAIEALSEGQRLVITLRDIDGWTSSETCSALDITETNQRVLLHRARSRVRAALERYFDREREA